MAKLVYLEVPRADIATVPIVAGQVIHCVDTGDCFYDNANTVRTLSELIIPVNSIASVSLPDHNRLYIDRHAYTDENGALKYKDASYATMYIYNNNSTWQQVLNSSEVNSFLSSYTELEPAILVQEGVNKAPVTFAKCVYTSDGDNVEDLVKEIKVLKVSQWVFKVTEDDTQSVLTEPPYPEFYKYPKRNFYIVTVNGILMPPVSYKVVESVLTFDPEYRTLRKDDIVNIMYIYQADLSTSDSRTAGYTDGGYILNGSIPTNKLANVTDSYMENDENKIPSAKALYEAHKNLLQKINNIDPSTVMYVADSSSNNYELVVFIARYSPTDMNTITVRTRYDLGSDCCIRINDFEPIPIFTALNRPIQDGEVRKNTVITLRYNATLNVFYIINPDIYKVVKDRAVFTLDGVVYRGPMVQIPVGLDNFIPGSDCLDVYQNNIRLFEGINYTLNGMNITLDGYFANDGDVFVFERTRVAASNL